MRRILLHGLPNNSGFVLLRSLLSLFIIAVSLSAILTGMALLARRGKAALEEAAAEIAYRNRTAGEQLR
ncbi:hypothetical protein LJC14_00520 [Treponema sp. OttesenSCG-928-L16]|nr:hypothetical protein [Treponema sp. OttesenSCG-928-L16]